MESNSSNLVAWVAGSLRSSLIKSRFFLSRLMLFSFHQELRYANSSMVDALAKKWAGRVVRWEVILSCSLLFSFLNASVFSRIQILLRGHFPPPLFSTLIRPSDTIGKISSQQALSVVSREIIALASLFSWN